MVFGNYFSKNKASYLSPEAEMLEVKVERGFAESVNAVQDDDIPQMDSSEEDDL